MWRLILLSVFSLQCSLLHAVETVIIGEVVSETTGEPVPNVNIRFRGTKIGTTSDEFGNYFLRVDMTAPSQLVFSAVGYHTRRFDIQPGTQAGLQVALRERVAALSEVVVSPSENPALGILRLVRAHRPLNDRILLPSLTSTALREQTLFISQINSRHLRRALWQSLQAGMIRQSDSTYILPLYRETRSFRLSGTEMIPADDRRSQALILTATDYSSLLAVQGNLDFYQPTVPLMGHAFLSPLAPSGNLYYRYYIDDEEPAAQSSPATTLVRIVFQTRNPFYPTFNGEMLIDTATFALRAIQAYVPPEVAVNYVNNLHVSQTLGEDNRLVDEQISVLLDFAVKTGQTATIFPTVLIQTGLRNIDPADTQTAGLAAERPYNPSGLTADIGLAADSAFLALDTMPVIRTAKWFATIATTGYIPTGTSVDIGHIEEILQVNRHEGVHVGLPFRTNERFSRTVSLEAAVGYGFRDRTAKGLGRISLRLPAPRTHYLQLEYRDGYVWSEVDDFDRMLRENSIGYGNFDFTAYAFEALRRDSLCVNTAVRQRRLQLYWFADWTPHLETRTYIRAGWQDRYAWQSLSAILRLSWGERKYDGFFARRYAYSPRYPVLFLGFETGHWALTASETSGSTNAAGLYAHLRLLLTQHAQLGMGGTLTYALQVGALFGAVPPFLLWQADANQGYAYDPYRFTFLYGNQLFADKYVTLQTEWNGQGVLFNLIPGIRYLRLRELIEAKIAYGYLGNPVRTLPASETGGLYAVSPKGGLYTELGVGIGNILRVCDLYSVWGFTPSFAWGIRFRIHLGL